MPLDAAKEGAQLIFLQYLVSCAYMADKGLCVPGCMRCYKATLRAVVALNQNI